MGHSTRLGVTVGGKHCLAALLTVISSTWLLLTGAAPRAHGEACDAVAGGSGGGVGLGAMEHSVLQRHHSDDRGRVNFFSQKHEIQERLHETCLCIKIDCK